MGPLKLGHLHNSDPKHTIHRDDFFLLLQVQVHCAEIVKASAVVTPEIGHLRFPLHLSALPHMASVGLNKLHFHPLALFGERTWNIIRAALLAG